MKGVHIFFLEILQLWRVHFKIEEKKRRKNKKFQTNKKKQNKNVTNS